MKKLRLLLCLVLAAALLSPAALADVIWEPSDPFITSHDCSRLPRHYTANGARGYVTLHDAPGSAMERENVANGEDLYCEYLYTDDAGETWGGVYKDPDSLRGWVKLSDCLVVYDYLSFEEEHRAEFVSYDPEQFPLGELEGPLVLWKYPGSGQVYYTLENYPEDLEIYFSTCYVDPEGNVWGYIGYLYGMRNNWVCLSDPDDPDLAPLEDLLPAQEEVVPPASSLPVPTSIWLTAGLVAAVVAATAGLIGVLYGKRRRGK